MAASNHRHPWVNRALWALGITASAGITAYGGWAVAMVNREAIVAKASDDQTRELTERIRELEREKMGLEQRAQQSQIDALTVRMSKMEAWQVETARKMEESAARSQEQLASINQTLAVMAVQLKAMAEGARP